MSAVFLAFMLVCAKPIFAADEDITALVMEGRFRIKCEEMYGEPSPSNETGISGNLRHYKCDDECQKCVEPLSLKEKGVRLANCIDECNKTTHRDPCKQGCEFLHRVVNPGGEQDGTLYDTRNIAVKGPYLFCRTYSELLINFEVELLSESSHVEPVYFIVYHRINETKPWSTVLWNELPLYVHLQGQSMQIAFAIVTSKGLHVSKGSNVFRHEGGWMSTLSDEDILDPPKDINVAVLSPTRGRLQGQLTWSIASSSKTCDYIIHWRAAKADHSTSKAFRVDQTKQYASPKLHYLLEDLAPGDNYTLDVISVAGDKENVNTVHFVTPPLDFLLDCFNETGFIICELGPPEHLTLLNVTHQSHNTSTAMVTWLPPHNITDIDAVKEYSLSWTKIPIMSKQLSEPHSESATLPPENTTFQLVGLHNGFTYVFKVAAVSSTTGKGKEAMLYFNTTDPRKEGTKYAQGAPSPDNKHSSYLLVTGLVVVAVLACFFGATYLYIKRKYGSMSSAVQQMQVQYSNGRRAVLLLNGDTYYNDLPGIEPDEWEVEYSGVAFGQQVGEGAFGTVSKATVVGLMGFPALKEVVVAVKKLKANANLEDRRNFLSEITLMKSIGKHLNIVSMLGCVTTGGPLCLIIEYCPHGDLRNYLRLIRDKVGDNDVIVRDAHTEPTNLIE